MAWTKITRVRFERKACRRSTDLSDQDFAVMEPCLPAANPLDRPRRIARQPARFTVISGVGRGTASGRQCIMHW